MNSSSENSPSRRRGSTGSLPALGRRVSDGSAKTVRWLGKQIKSFKKDDDSDSDELWGTSIERPFDLEDPNCPIERVPSGYVPLHELANRARPQAVERHWHKTSSFSHGAKRVTRKPTKLDLKGVCQPSNGDGQGTSEQRAQPSGKKSKAPLDDLPPRPQSRVDQLKSTARGDVVSPAPKPRSPRPSFFGSKKKELFRDNTPGSSATWSGPRISTPRRRPDVSRWNEIYEAPKEDTAKE
ncbi:hypothetical protein PTTG_12398 [Puccinia triticina 1-1 BBBD Race 1]|uniref:Uncharacterized protein n=2 Tax=Puccinia triticina TaxID=208348 RepID=A0A180GM99_PUCT1|nr:uncharacterized protein PtA15_7A259 [Puccinia triticina]OAV93701.1 hypothetical protein PTTG_12398 [Puccinia triticina 1-1 BBBD Race 1]WAQ86533.1 hypothetical protein PtA15_7A259 [Puccinia triticina]WAR56401.1 hypothetical protein PtB15_7B249 [Puccinia triticina]